MRKIAIVPTLFTLANGVCGFGAITLAARIPRGSSPSGAEIDWLWGSAVLILIAMVFDALDGHVARMARSTSDFGGQLDSLCDAISFGVAPAFLMLKLCCDHDRFGVDGLWTRCIWVIAALYVVCAILRLARFNIENDHDEESHMLFSGLPSPAAAGAIASIGILWHELRDQPMDQILRLVHIPPQQVETFLEFALPMATIVVAGLMVSHVPYPHFANHFVRGNKSFTHLVKVIFAMVLIVMLRQLTLPVVFWCFALASPLMLGSRHVMTQLGREPTT